ncbi:hypothetical protein MMC22_002706 [Lobaria immixta]|nr:hypothetical protein [Lobaria immixta]
MSVGLSETDIIPYIQKTNKMFEGIDIVVACINSPKNVTVSGRELQIDALKSLLGDRVFARKLQVEVAYHSPQMNDIAAEYLTSIDGLEAGESRKGRPVMISSVTARRISVDELSQSEYWVKNMVSPVRFSDALTELSGQSIKNLTKKLGRAHRNAVLIHDILEVGPHSALQSSIRDSLKTIERGKELSYSSVLVRHMSALDTMLHMAGHLHCLGYSVNLAAINRAEENEWKTHSPTTLTNLPEYPFDHSKKFWHEGRLSKDFRLRKYPRLNLLGTPAQDWNPLEARWRKFIRLSETPWVEDHKINGSIVYPAAGMLVMAIEGVRQLDDGNRLITGYCIKDVTFQKPLVISQSQNGVEVQLYLRSVRSGSEKDSAWSDFRLCVYEDGHWAENCRGVIQVEYENVHVEFKADNTAAESLRHYRELYDHAMEACDRVVDRKLMYEHLQKMGVSYGPAFQSLNHLACNDKGEAIAEILTSRRPVDQLGDPDQSHVIHPTSLDAIAQLVYVALTKGAREHIPTTIPTRIGKFWIAQPSHSNSPAAAPAVQAFTKSEFKGYRTTESSLFAVDKRTGSLLMKILSLETTTVANRDAVSKNQAGQRQLCYNIDCKPDIDILNPQQLRYNCEDARRQNKSQVEFQADLAFVLFMFMSKTLDALTEREVENLKPHFQYHVRWMRLQIEKFEAGKLIPAHPEWKSLLRNTEYQDTLCRRIESKDGEGSSIIRIGQNLLEILQGNIDPLIHLDESNLISEYYLKSKSENTYFSSFLQYLEVLSHKNLALKVLQVGGGFGGPTAPLLDASANHDNPLRYAHFDYTDITPAFFQMAQEKYNGCSPRVHFRWLDIENEPQKSGFEPGTYDLIIASSGLRAAPNLETAIQNLRSLLKTGGKFALFEVTEDVMRAGFVFGLLPSWWSIASGHLNDPGNHNDLNGTQDNRLRPYISQNEWHTMLGRNRFTGTDLIIPDYQDSMYHEISILISTAIELSHSALQFPKTVIVVREDSLIQHAIAQQLSKSLVSEGCTDHDTVFLQRGGSVKDFANKFCIFLVELDSPILQSIDEETFVNLQSILLSAAGILWVTGGGGTLLKTPAFGMIDGLARVMRTERSRLVSVTLALESTESIEGKQIEQITQIFKKTISVTNDDYESEYIEKDGMMHINRLVEANQVNRGIHVNTRPQQSKMQEFGSGPPLKLSVASPGLLDSLQFLEDTEDTLPLAPHEVEIKIYATGVNFMDCLTVLGRINQSTLGGECAGVVTRSGSKCNLQPGDRVCACTLDCFKTYVRCDEQLAVEIPVELSYVEAAALPISFVTTHYALQEFARLQKGETVLIHSASGGTGQSAIQIAKYIGAEVYATVGSDTKKKWIQDLYEIPENHIFCSRNTAFAEEIMRMTHGRGVDVVLNSLSDEGLVASWECIASFGRFVEIGKKDIHSHSNLPMFPFAKNVSFGAVDIAAMSRERPALLRKSLQAVMALVTQRQLHASQPLDIYPVSDIEDAFRYMQSGKNMGKAVINFETNSPVLTVLDTKPTYYFDSNATYVISGGLGGLGRSAARWMAARGAKNLILLSRSGPRSDAARTLIEQLRAQGVQVEAPSCDVTCTDSLSTVLAHCAQIMPPIRGCIQGTMVLKDAIFENMTFAQWDTSIRPKVQGSWNLHTLLPTGMDFFILLSSISGVIGSGGQTNYAAGNTYMDALARFRISRGEKAVSLDLGWMESEGVVSESEFLQKGLAAAGYLMPIAQQEFFALLDHYCNPALERLTSRSCQTVVGLETRAAVRAKGIDDPLWMRRPMFRAMQAEPHGVSSDVEVDSNTVDYVAAFARARSVAEAGARVADGLVGKLARALAVPPDDVDPNKPLHAYGVDSLLAVELRNWFAKEMNADVTIFDVMGSTSITALGIIVAANSQFHHPSWETDV